jgi:hypothetical protein
MTSSTRVAVEAILVATTALAPTVVLADQYMRCESDGYKYRLCQAEIRGYVGIERQLSKSACVQGVPGTVAASGPMTNVPPSCGSNCSSTPTATTTTRTTKRLAPLPPSRSSQVRRSSPTGPGMITALTTATATAGTPPASPAGWSASSRDTS